MRNHAVTCVISGLFLAAAGSLFGNADQPRSFDGLAIVDVDVIAMDVERVLRRHTVLVKDGLVAGVGPTHSLEIPAGARRIEGTGRYLMPGLVDAHVHLRDERELLSYLAYGVTSVVNLGGPSGNVTSVLELRARVTRGERLGPRIYTTGRVLDGEPPIYPPVSTVVATPEAARSIVNAQLAEGADFIKVYNNVGTDTLRAAVQAAHERAVSVWGHVPRIDGRATALQQAINAGLDVIAHGEELFFTLLYGDVEAQLDRGLVPTVKQADVDASVRLVRASGTAIIPNLSFVAMTRAQLNDLAGVLGDPEARFLDPTTLAMWRRSNPTTRSDRRRFDLRERGKRAVVRRLTLALSAAEVPLLLGTDASAPGLYPGKSAHVELAELVAAGLTPYQALASGTRTAGRVIGRQTHASVSFGTVTVGSRADLILLGANPLDDVTNAATIEAVCVRGDWFTRAEIDLLRTAPR